MPRFNEEDASIEGAYQLQATLSLPVEHHEQGPAALLICGAGKLSTREGMTPIAHRLTECGFVTLRYDKRGTGNSQGVFEETGLWDLVDDILSGIELLKARPEVDRNRIILVGNSEGTKLAVAATAKVSVQGLVLLVPSVEMMQETQVRQLQIFFEDLQSRPEFTMSLDEFKAQQLDFTQQVLQSTTDSVQIQDVVIPAKWIREHYKYDVRIDLANVKCPTIAIGGEKDLFCVPDDARVIAELVNGPSECHIIADMTHALRSTEQEVNAANVFGIHSTQYGEPMDVRVLDLIEQWAMRFFST